MKRYIFGIAALSISSAVAGQALASGQWGTAKCNFMDSSGHKSAYQPCKAGMAASSSYDSSVIVLNGKAYWHSMEASDQGVWGAPKLHNVTTPFHVNDDQTVMCAPIVGGNGQQICATDMHDNLTPNDFPPPFKSEGQKK